MKRNEVFISTVGETKEKPRAGPENAILAAEKEKQRHEMRIESIREEARRKHEIKMLKLSSEDGAKEARRKIAEGDKYVYDIKALKAKA